MAVQADSYYLYLDDPQAVTLSATRSGTEATDSIAYASRLSDRKTRGIFGGIALQTNEQGWNIPNALLSNVSDIRPGDKLTEDGDSTVWIVMDVTQDALKTQWILKCEKGKS